MRNWFFKIVLLLVSITLIHTAKAQTEFCNEINKNSVYIELGGNGVLYSLNYDRFFEISNRLKASCRLGFHYSENLNDNGNRFIGFPIEISGLYSIFKNKHFLEIGTGLTFMNDNDFSMDNKAQVFIWVLRAGYRYQKPEGGLFLRLGFTPMYDFYVMNPMSHIDYHSWFLFGGVGIGYTF